MTGTVQKADAEGSGPEEGARIVGLFTSCAWAELAAVPTNTLVELPENVSFEQGALLLIAEGRIRPRVSVEAY